MSKASQCLNDFYYDLLANPQQTVSLDIPTDLGAGKISQTTTKQGVVLSDWKINYSADMDVQGLNSHEYIQIIFCLNEGMSWGVMDDRHALSIHKGESYIYRGHGETEYSSYAGQCDFHFKCVKLPFKYFSYILKEHFEAAEISVYEGKLLGSASKVKITPYMERILAELKDFVQYRGGLGYLFLESKILELLSIYLSEVLEISILMSGQYPMSRTDREAVLEVKRLIDSQIAYAPSCMDLSKQVHMNVSKLSKGFSDLFGKPIHTYIIDQRLKKAASLLIQSELPIFQIAALVGYTKPSNFAAAFKKKYGVVPKQYKENQMAD